MKRLVVTVLAWIFPRRSKPVPPPAPPAELVNALLHAAEWHAVRTRQRIFNQQPSNPLAEMHAHWRQFEKFFGPELEAVGPMGRARVVEAFEHTCKTGECRRLDLLHIPEA